MKEKLLITGSSGYLGREIISDPRIKKFEIITLDKNKVSNPDIHVDLNSQKLEDILSRTLDLEVNYSILNLAAARTDYASNETYFLENIKATENFLSVLDSMKVYVKKFIHLSSVAIFEGLQLMEEEVCFDELSSDNCYQYSKATQLPVHNTDTTESSANVAWRSSNRQQEAGQVRIRGHMASLGQTKS